MTVKKLIELWIELAGTVVIWDDEDLFEPLDMGSTSEISEGLYKDNIVSGFSSEEGKLDLYIKL